MRRVLFVSNGHGEVAIASRIARELSGDPLLALDHLPLVGEGRAEGAAALVGPRRPMPSGGLVAMGNVRAFASDVVAGFPRLFAEQLACVRDAGSRYDTIVPVGDAYALLFALAAGTRNRPIYVGTAKSVYVAPYGPFERVLLRRAARIFVRDRATAERLRREGVPAEAPGNVIADLAADGGSAAASGTRTLAILPGSRERAYEDGVRLARVARALGERVPERIDAVLSVAPGLDAARFARALEADGWQAEGAEVAELAPPPLFALQAGSVRLFGSGRPVGELIRSSRLVIGQAGTANEEAASLGVPVVALAAGDARDASGDGWYRMRQRRLLGEALALVPADPEVAAAAVARLLAAPEKLAAMSAAGRDRMGPPGGAAFIARAVRESLHGAAGA